MPELADLPPTRQAKNITLAAAATHMGTYVSKIVRTELGPHPTTNRPPATANGSTPLDQP